MTTCPLGKIRVHLAFAGNGNSVGNPGITAINPVPLSAQTDNLAAYPGGFENVSYKGAFDDTNWASGWTLTFSNK